MASISVWKVTFKLTNAAGSVSAGPYTANIGVSGGTRGDQHTPSVAASLITAISSNLLGILQSMGYGGSAAPGGTVVIETMAHASAPDVWT